MGKAQVKELTHEDPEFLPVQYDMTAAKIKQLTKEYDPKTIPKASEKGDDGYLVIHEKTMAIVKVRTNIDKVRKGLKADALAWGKKVDGEARRLTEIVEGLEAPWRAVKTELDDKEAREEAEARQAEVDRMKEIEERIAYIRGLSEGLLGANSATIQERLDEFKDLVIDEDKYGDYVEAARITGDAVIHTLTAALAERKAFEEGETKLAREKAELKAEQDILAKGKADLKASEDAAEQRKLDEENRIKEEAERQEREAAAAEAEKKGKAELKKRLPEDIKVRAYADELDAVDLPFVSDPDLRHLVADAHAKVKDACSMIYKQTQVPKEKK